MIIHEYEGVLAEIIDAINEAGGPPKIRRIELTQAEMHEVWSSNAFRTSVSNYYGSSTAPTLEGIIADHQGNIISMYLNGVLICVGPWEPVGPYADLTWGPLTTQNNASTLFATDQNYLWAGERLPSDGMVVGSNGDIELALAIRKANDPASYANGATYNIELADDESWNFVVSVGSLNEHIYSPLDMYNIRLIVDTDPASTNNTQIIFTLGYAEVDTRGVKRNQFIWYRGLERAITNSAQSPAIVDDNGTARQVGIATQMSKQMRSQFISRYVPASVSKSPNGSFLGTYTFTLEATPKFGDKMADAVSVQAIANVVKKS